MPGPLATAARSGTDVDLLPPVGLALGQFAADPGVAAEVRALDVLDRQLGGLRQGEERARRADHAVLDRGRDAVPGEVEEAEFVSGLPQFGTECRGLLGATVEAGEIEYRQGCGAGHSSVYHRAPTLSQ